MTFSVWAHKWNDVRRAVEAETGKLSRSEVHDCRLFLRLEGDHFTFDGIVDVMVETILWGRNG